MSYVNEGDHYSGAYAMVVGLEGSPPKREKMTQSWMPINNPPNWNMHKCGL